VVFVFGAVSVCFVTCATRKPEALQLPHRSPPEIASTFPKVIEARTHIQVQDSQGSKGHHYYVWIAIMTSRTEFERRTILREKSWISNLPLLQSLYPDKDITYRFIVGGLPHPNSTEDATGVDMKLQQENQQFGDLMVVPELMDTYDNLVEKVAHVMGYLAKQQDFTFDWYLKSSWVV
jgi:hypothetical protein